jgi:hypothetical protein
MMDRDQFTELSDGEISLMISALMDEKLRRAVETGDPETLIKQALIELFDTNGPKPPRILSNGIVAVPGYLKDSSGEKHECNMFTVRLPDHETETWAWEDDTGTFISGETSKVAKVRRSVNLHQAIEGLVLIQHVMKWDGRKHTRTSTKAWEVRVKVNEETGELVSEELALLSNWTPSRLPPPPGSESENRS